MDWAWTSCPFFFLLVMVDGDLTHLAGSAGVSARPRHTAGTGVLLGDRSTEDSGVAGRGAAGDAEALDA